MRYSFVMLGLLALVCATSGYVLQGQDSVALSEVYRDNRYSFVLLGLLAFVCATSGLKVLLDENDHEHVIVYEGNPFISSEESGEESSIESSEEPETLRRRGGNRRNNSRPHHHRRPTTHAHK